MGKITQSEFERRVLEKLGTDYEVLGTYEGRDIPVRMVHHVCGNEFFKRPHDVWSKSSGCPFCNGNKRAKYNEQWVRDNTPAPFHYISGYKKMTEKCLFHCDRCKQDFLQTPTKLITSHIFGCGCCPTKHKTNEQFLLEISDVLNEYEVLDEYINIGTPIRFKHKKCNCEFMVSPYQFIYRSKKKYCPICYYRKSKGEIEIAKVLSGHNIDFIKEKTFQDLPDRRFDFFLPSYNTIIEFDGEQHFKESYYSRGSKFIELQNRDQEKNRYCLDHQIRLYRIPYTDYEKIPDIIDNILEEESSTTIEKYLITEQSRNIS